MHFIFKDSSTLQQILKYVSLSLGQEKEKKEKPDILTKKIYYQVSSFY